MKMDKKSFITNQYVYLKNNSRLDMKIVQA
jgi:hypothetical protein